LAIWRTGTVSAGLISVGLISVGLISVGTFSVGTVSADMISVSWTSVAGKEGDAGVAVVGIFLVGTIPAGVISVAGKEEAGGDVVGIAALGTVSDSIVERDGGTLRGRGRVEVDVSEISAGSVAVEMGVAMGTLSFLRAVDVKSDVEGRFAQDSDLMAGTFLQSGSCLMLTPCVRYQPG